MNTSVRNYNWGIFAVTAGGWAVFSANGWFAFLERYSVYDVVSLQIATMLPAMFLTLFTPALTLRTPRKRVLLIGGVFSIVLRTTVVAFAIAGGLDVVVLTITQFVGGCLGAITRPISAAYMKDISPQAREHHTPILNGAVTILGAAIGLGAVFVMFCLAVGREQEVARLGVGWANGLLLLTQLMQLYLLWYTQPKGESGDTVLSARVGLRDVFKGFAELWRKPYFRALLLFGAVRKLFQVTYFLFFPLVVEVYGQGGVAYTGMRFLGAGLAAMGMFGWVLLQRRTDYNLTSLSPLLVLGSISAVATMIYPQFTNWSSVVVTYALLWMLLEIINPGQSLLEQNLEGQQNTGHVRAAFSALQQFAPVVHLLVLAPLPALIGPRLAMQSSGCLALMSLLLIWVFYRKHLRQPDA